MSEEQKSEHEAAHPFSGPLEGAGKVTLLRVPGARGSARLLGVTAATLDTRLTAQPRLSPR